MSQNHLFLHRIYESFQEGEVMDNISEIIIQVRSGHIEAYSEIVKHYQNPIYGYLLRMMLNHQDAEDITQETFVTAFYHLNQLKDIHSFKSWLFSIAHNQAMQFFRQKRKNNEAIEKIKINLRDASLKMEDVNLLDTINEILSPFEMSLLMLRVVEEMSYDELSICLNKNATALRKQYERIRKKLQTQLDRKKEVVVNDEY